MKRLFLLLVALMSACAPLPAADMTAAEATALPTPQSVYRIALDCGHGGPDCGAVGTDTGVREADLNLDVCDRVAALLTEAGVTVVRTRTDETALGDTKREDMRARGEILSAPDLDATVSVHMNKFPDRSVSGPMAYYQTGAEAGQQLATCCIGALTAALLLPERSANPGNNFVTRVPAAPSVLIECGFLSNPDDERHLLSEHYRQTLAEAIAQGVLDYLNEFAS